MPLHADDKVIRGIQLHCFNHAIARRNRTHPQIVARRANRLMMAGIHRNVAHFRHRHNSRSTAIPSAISTGCAFTTSRPG